MSAPRKRQPRQPVVQNTPLGRGLMAAFTGTPREMPEIPARKPRKRQERGTR